MKDCLHKQNMGISSLKGVLFDFQGYDNVCVIQRKYVVLLLSQMRGDGEQELLTCFGISGAFGWGRRGYPFQGGSENQILY